MSFQLGAQNHRLNTKSNTESNISIKLHRPKSGIEHSIQYGIKSQYFNQICLQSSTSVSIQFESSLALPRLLPPVLPPSLPISLVTPLSLSLPPPANCHYRWRKALISGAPVLISTTSAGTGMGGGGMVLGGQQEIFTSSSHLQSFLSSICKRNGVIREHA